MKEEILKKFGENSTGSSTVAEDDIEFGEVTLSDDTSVSAFYTFENGVYILDSEGMDNDFDDYSKEDQKLIFDSIMSLVKES